MAAPRYGSLPFDEQIRLFRRKLSLPTRAWTDIWQAEHDHAFVVAGAYKAELLADLRAAVDKAISQGTTLREFRKDFDQVVARHGWSYRGGRGWRTRVIFETNLRSSYQAARFAQMKAVAAERPYWLYRHSDAVATPRPLHLAWDGLVVRHDDPWLKTHFPPNGWGCKCRMFALSQADLERMGKSGPDKAPPIEWETRRVGVRGPSPRTVRVPKGIDPGWAYAPGESVLDRSVALFMGRAAALPPNVAVLAVADVVTRERLLRGLLDQFRAWAGDVLGRGKARNTLFTLGAIPPRALTRLAERGRIPESAGVTIRDVELLHLDRDAKRAARTATGRQKALPRADIERLPEIIAAPRALLWDTQDPAMLYVFDPTDTAGTGKVVVRVDFVEKVRETASGKRRRIRTNSVRTGGVVDVAQLRSSRYELLEGGL